MSHFLTRKLKIPFIELENNLVNFSIPKIPFTAGLQRKPTHYYNNEFKVFNILDEKTFTVTYRKTRGQEVFIFDDFNDKFLPFTKVIPRLQTSLDANRLKIYFQSASAWSRLDSGKVQLFFSYYYDLTEEAVDEDWETTFDVDLSIDIAIKNFIQPNLSHGPQL